MVERPTGDDLLKLPGPKRQPLSGCYLEVSIAEAGLPEAIFGQPDHFGRCVNAGYRADLRGYGLRHNARPASHVEDVVCFSLSNGIDDPHNACLGMECRRGRHVL